MSAKSFGSRPARAMPTACLAAMLAAGLACAAQAQSQSPSSSVQVGANGSDATKKGDSGGNAQSGPSSISVTNSTVLNTSFSTSYRQLFEGASVGGNGGNAYYNGNDLNGNPDYDGGTGGSAGAGGSVTVANQGAISVTANGSYDNGARLVVGVSGGGNGGTGDSASSTTPAQPGGAAGIVLVSNYSNLGLVWNWTSNATNFGLGIEGVMGSSEAGAGASSATSQSNGGAGGNASGVTVNQYNSSISITAGSFPGAGGTGSFTTPRYGYAPGTNPSQTLPLVGAAAVASSRGGPGGNGFDRSTAGAGGSGGPVSLTVSDGILSITAASNAGTNGAQQVAGAVAVSTGGNGGTGGSTQDYSNGGAGGAANTASVLVQTRSLATGISTNGLASPVVLAGSAGGSGGAGTDYNSANLSGSGGRGGSGGAASDTTVTIKDSIALQSGGYASPGIVSASIGGIGAPGGLYQSGLAGNAGNGGAAGAAGSATVVFGNSTLVTQQGSSPGIDAVSAGGFGGTGGYAGVPLGGTAGDGGAGGAAGTVSVSVASGASIGTAGAFSPAIFAYAVGGNGAGGGNASALQALSGKGGDGGAAGMVIVTNGGALTTAGSNAPGIMALSWSGNGGNAGSAGGGTVSSLNGGDAGTAAGVSVTNTGAIATAGAQSIGILAQSLNGGGGQSGDATGPYAIGGSGGKGADGGTASLTSNGTIATQGDLSHGAVAMSIGGGGGAAGNATSYSAVIGLSIGGSGGGGGNGGAVSVSSTAFNAIQTYASNAAGLVGLSVGGGGGTGGAAYSISGGIGFGAAVAVGGNGGSGGNGGAVTMNLYGSSITTGRGVLDAVDPVTLPDDTATTPLPVDSYGIAAVSIGGGGGIGGSAMAKTYVLDLPIPETTSSIALSGTYANGGSGGSGGKGGDVTVNLTQGMNILTYGNGSHAVTAVSAGGGGGLGGDSSATSTAFGFKTASKVAGHTNYNLVVAVSLGGSAGNGGDGGTTSVTLGGSNGTPLQPPMNQTVSIQTLGDYADGVQAISTGGGGGNAGFGAGSTQNGTSATTALKLSVAVGATGGLGGSGGPVNVYAFQGTSIATAGDTAYGIEAISTGGGGGAASGGSYQLGLPSISTVNQVAGGGSLSGPAGVASNITVKAGTDGASGGNGGAINVVLQTSNVATTGQSATAVLAVSTGGGGGVAGSAGSSGSSDDPTVLEQAKAGKKFVSGLAGYLLDVKKAIQQASSQGEAVKGAVLALFPSLNLNLSFGATSGGGGTGGAVTVSATDSSISTLGDWARGIQAQSVGGGGGTGGGAVAGGTQGAGNIMKVNLDVALGGSGGTGGNGGTVKLALGNTSISTAGYAAYDVFAQSVGGGGGDVGSAETNASGYFSLGVSGSNNASSGGTGGMVTLSQSGPTISRLSTAGDAAPGIVLQSVGGGGGVAGQGYTLSASIIGEEQPLTATFNVGATGGTGNGGIVTTDAAALPLLAITTTGASSYGILAQSVGGGGGLSFQNPGTPGTYKVGGAGRNATGGAVTVSLRDGSSITTSGNGSDAIFAQSVGGGGGIADFANGSGAIYEATASDGPNAVTNGNGGAVTVNTGNATIRTTGTAAIGIFAQSVGAGGGTKSTNDGTGLIVGTTGARGSNGTGGLVTVVQSGTLTASGSNAIGIFAQSTGQNGNGPGSSSGVAITVNGAVQGGSAGGAGIWTDTDYTTNTITIAAGGSVGAASGQSIVSKGYGITNVDNFGTLSGSANLQSGNPTAGTLTNEAQGTLAVSGTLDANVVNAGLIAPPAANAFAPVTIAGSFRQTATGVFAPHVDFTGRRSDSLVVTGDAVLGGKVTPLVSSVLPGVAISVVTVDGAVSGSLSGGASSLFGYGVSRTGNQFALAATSANFAPASFNLPASRAATASGLQSIWDAGGTPALGPLFALLGNTADASPAAYASQLRQLSPDATLAPGARGLAGAQNFANNTLSCPTFQGTTAMLVEGQCGWMRITGRSASQDNSNGVSDFRLDTVTWQIGGQYELSPGWFVGGSLAYEESWLSSSDKLNTGNGQSGYGAVTLKHQTGPWLFAASAFGGAGQFNTSRSIGLLGTGVVAKGNPDTSNAGLLLRAAYTIGTESLYLRPNLSLSAIHVATGAYHETGAGVLNLSVDSASQTTVMATPMLELGGRIPLGPDLLLRPFIAAGVSFLSNDSWRQTGRLASAPAGTGSFTTAVPIDPVEARVSAGVQLYTSRQIDLRLQYDGEYSSTIAAHAGSFVASLRF